MKRLSVKFGLFFAWIISLLSTIISLVMSEWYHFAPCSLCWVQRIFMFPLAIILGIATYYGDRKAANYVLPLGIIGGCVALYHYLYQKVPGLAEIATCSPDVPCDKDYLNLFGFITIPLLSFLAFASILYFYRYNDMKQNVFPPCSNFVPLI